MIFCLFNLILWDHIQLFFNVFTDLEVGCESQIQVYIVLLYNQMNFNAKLFFGFPFLGNQLNNWSLICFYPIN